MRHNQQGIRRDFSERIMSDMAKKNSDKNRNKNSELSVGRVVEICAASPKSFEDAVDLGIQRAAKRLRDVRGAWVKEMKVKVENGKVSEYRVNLQVTFVLDD
jgi:flavin-binding protein dodecin